MRFVFSQQYRPLAEFLVAWEIEKVKKMFDFLLQFWNNWLTNQIIKNKRASSARKAKKRRVENGL